MIEDLLLRCLHHWRTLSRKQWLQVAIPFVLSLDMVHNIYIVAAEWNNRVKGWREDDERRVTAAVSSALRQIAGHCCQKDRDVWPQAITRQLGLPASTVRQLPESREETILEEHDLLDWLTAVRQDAEAMVLTRQVTVIKACEEPALSSQPARTTSPPAVLSLPQPWQQRIELVTSVFTASRNLAVSQLQRLRGLGAADVAVPRSTAHADKSFNDWQRSEEDGAGSDGRSRPAEARLDSAENAREQQAGWAERMAASFEARLEDYRRAAHTRWPLPQAQFNRRSALRFRGRFLGIMWPPDTRKQSCELDLSNM